MKLEEDGQQGTVSPEPETRTDPGGEAPTPRVNLDEEYDLVPPQNELQADPPASVKLYIHTCGIVCASPGHRCLGCSAVTTPGEWKEYLFYISPEVK